MSSLYNMLYASKVTTTTTKGFKKKKKKPLITYQPKFSGMD